MAVRLLAGPNLRRRFASLGHSFQCAHRRGCGLGRRVRCVCHILDQRVPCLEHTLDVQRARGRYGLAQRILGQDDFDAGWLAMIPFRPVARTIRADDAVLGRDPVPQLRFRRAGATDAAHVDGKPIGMQ